jgi:hypothetical protein
VCDAGIGGAGACGKGRPLVAWCQSCSGSDATLVDDIHRSCAAGLHQWLQHRRGRAWPAISRACMVRVGQHLQAFTACHAAGVLS